MDTADDLKTCGAKRGTPLAFDPQKERGLGYSPRDPPVVNRRVGTKCARAAPRPCLL